MTEAKAQLEEAPRPIDANWHAMEIVMTMRANRQELIELAKAVSIGVADPLTEDLRVRIYSELILLLDVCELLDRQGEVEDVRTGQRVPDSEWQWTPEDGNGPVI